MQVPSDSIDIRRAFQRHRSSFQLLGLSRRSRFVLLFYAAECGLKYLIMTSQTLPTTDHLKSSLRTMLGLSKKAVELHDIEQLCTAANVLPVDVGFAPAPFTVNSASFPAYKMHEAARYGVKVPEPYISDVEVWLAAVVTEVAKRLTAQGV